MDKAAPIAVATRAPQSGTASTPDPGEPRYARYVLGVLLLVYCLSFIDRQIIAVLSPQIKVDLELSDTELGALKGLAFALLYAGMGVPLAIVGDRWNRVNLLAICLAIWSAMTALSGAASSYLHLFLARVGVGIGEAGGVAPAHSMISDYFPRWQRATALGVFSLGIPIGIFSGYILGPLLATAIGWRATFVAVGLPGLLVAVLLKLTVREPSRGKADLTAAAGSAPVGWLATLGHLTRIPTYRTVVYAGALNAFCGYALSNWLADFLVRSHHFAFRDVGLPLAIVNGVGVGVGIYLGGKAADRLAKRDAAYYLLIPAWSFSFGCPLLIAAFSVSETTLSLSILFAAFILIYMSIAPLFAVLQALAPADSRALSAAFFLLWQNLVGAGLGPFLMGAGSDVLHRMIPNADSLRLALTSLGLVTGLAAIILFLGVGKARKVLNGSHAFDA